MSDSDSGGSGSARSQSGSGSDSEDSIPDEFHDGYDDDLMGDEEDRQRLKQMTEKEREQEIFNRLEKREVLKTRYVILSWQLRLPFHWRGFSR